MGSIDSEVVSVSLYPMNINSFQEPVTLTLKNTQVSANIEVQFLFSFVLCSLSYVTITREKGKEELNEG